MPFSYHFDKERDLLILKARGVLTPQSLKDCIESYAEDPAFHPGIDALIEFGDDLSVEFGRGSLQILHMIREGTLADTLSALAEASEGEAYRIASVGESSKAQTIFVSIMGLANSNGEFEAFSDRARALRWLGR